jgi:uncharacterized protein (DUF433 family)
MTVAAAEPLPLATDPDGVVRVGGTRVTLDTIAAAFQEGMSAEGIVEQYPSLRLDDVYFVIGYIIRHSDAVNAYLRARQQAAAEVRRENEARFNPIGVSDRLLARRRSERPSFSQPV